MLSVHRANRAEPLVEGLARRLADDPPADPFEPATVAVPSHGMERWVSQRLAGALGARGGEAGVCSNVAFPFPGRVLGELRRAALGEETTPDPWEPQRLVWTLVELLASELADDSYAPLRAHLAPGGALVERRRFPLARSIAELFDRYAHYRPEMLQRWHSGEDRGPDGVELAEHTLWQARLWRAARERIGVASAAERHAEAVAALAARELAVRLPYQRLELFGVVALPPTHVELLTALARHAEVVVNLIAPCRVWQLGWPASDRAHPLLASCATAAADFHTVLSERLPTDEKGGAEPLSIATEAFVEPRLDREARQAGGGATRQAGGGAAQEGGGATALEVLQSDLLADRRRGRDGESRVPVAAEDASVRVHACHGPMRQLEVLREALYELLEADPTLEPRDVAVLTPDIATYNPLISAIFSAGDSAPGGAPRLPFRVADRSVSDENPIAAALEAMLELVGSRVTASGVLDLLGRPPARRRFGLHDDGLRRVAEWLTQTGVSWGIDEEHRNALVGLAEKSHTWGAGLDRLVLGTAMPDPPGEDRMLGQTVPYDDVEGADVELLGTLLGATERLFGHLRALRAKRTLPEWRSALATAVDDCFADDPDHPGQRDEVHYAIAVLEEDARGPDGTPLAVEPTFEELRAALSRRLSSSSGPARFAGGAVTFCGLVPLRNVPHRVVCLLGMDDGVFPGTPDSSGFDLLGVQHRPGDPDRRTEDRQMFLDAVCAARQHLLVTYTGANPHTNEAQQPAAPVKELLDVLDDSVVPATGAAARDHVVTDHRLHAHDPGYFVRDGELPRSFDSQQLAAARARAGPSQEAPEFFGERLPEPSSEELDLQAVELAELARFLEHPVRFVLTQRVGVSLGDDDQRLDDRDPVELDQLERWRVRSELLERRRAELPEDRWRDALLASGRVPARALGERTLAGSSELVDEIRHKTADLTEELRQLSVDLTVPLGAGESARVVGDVELAGARVCRIDVSKVKPKHKLQLWVRYLAATAQEPASEISGVLVGRKDNTEAVRYEIAPLAELPTEDTAQPPADRARALLGELVALYRRGHREPLPLFPSASSKYADQLPKKGHDAAMADAEKSYGHPWRPERDPYHRQAFGDAELSELPQPADGLDFAELACAVWEPLSSLVSKR
jgi:exodeoxyribonuclease V gamma subunit